MVGYLLLLGLAVYANALRNPFIIDDSAMIGGDIRVCESRIGELVTGPYWPPPRRDLLFRPLVKITFALNWALSHEPWTFRVPNLGLHVGVAFVLFLLARDLTGSFRAALVTAIVFVVHPVHTEPLNVIVGRADLGAAVFGLLAVWLYWRDGLHPYARGWPRPVLAAACFAAAVLFKESALPVVGIVALLDAWPPKTSVRRRPAGWFRRRVVRCYLPLLVIVAVYFAARVSALGGVARGAERIKPADNIIANAEHGLGPGDSGFLARWGTPVATFGKTVRLMVWPHPLCWDYSYAAIDTVKRVSDPRLVFGLGCLLAVGAAMAVSFRRGRVVFVALGIGLVTYSIVSNTFVLIGTVFAERLLYLPSAGFCLLVGVVAGSRLRPATKPRGMLGRGRPAVVRPVLVVLVLIVGVYGWLIVDRNRDWQSRDRLDATDVKTNPRSCRLLSSAAADAVNAGDFDRAFEFAGRAVSLHPDYPGGWRSLAAVQWHRGSAEKALSCFKRCFELGGAGDESAVILATTIMTSIGDYAQAIRLLRQHVAKHPLAATARNNLAWYLLTAEPPELRDPHAALGYAEAALELQPQRGGIIDTYVEALLALDRRAEAREVLEQSLPRVSADDPDRPELQKKLAQLAQGE